MTLTVVVILALAVVYWFTLGRRFAECAPTPDDLARTMAGDSVIDNPTHSAMDAITIDASPEDIWPWLVQLGYQRGGLYSYDWLDRLFGFLDRPSAIRVMPEFQHLAVGDTIRLGPRQTLTVAAVEPSRVLVLTTWCADSSGCGSLGCIRSTTTEHDWCRVGPNASKRLLGRGCLRRS
jgi:hypothetical protein